MDGFRVSTPRQDLDGEYRLVQWPTSKVFCSISTESCSRPGSRSREQGEAVREVRRRGLACGFLTNTTSRSSSLIAQGLCDAGIEVEASQIVTAARLTGEYVRATYPDARAWVLNHGDVSADLEGIEFDDADPEVVILGGAGPEFTHEALSRVLELLLAGVPVVAMHRGMMWETVDGLRIDTGTYLPGFEEVAGVNIAAVG